MNYLQKLRREAAKAVSGLCLKSARITYLGTHYRVPLIFGVGSSHFGLKQDAMSRFIANVTARSDGAVFDVGVNIGAFLLKLRAVSNARYVGFEPNALCNYYVHELVRMNGFKDVVVLPVALSSEEKMCTFYARRQADKMGSLNEFVRKDSHRTSSYDFDVVTRRGDDVVEALAIDSLAMIKIDTEGAESMVIEGLKSTIEKFRPVMFCEVWRIPDVSHPAHREIADRRSGLYRLLQSLDYAIYKDDATGRLREVVSEEAFLGMNPRDNDFIFCHRARAADLVADFTS